MVAVSFRGCAPRTRAGLCPDPAKGAASGLRWGLTPDPAMLAHRSSSLHLGAYDQTHHRTQHPSWRARLYLLRVDGRLGLLGAQATPLDAIPDMSKNQVIVYTEWPGRGPLLVEDQVTFKLTSSFGGLPGLKRRCAVRASLALVRSI